MTETPMTQSTLKLPAMREGDSKQYPLGGAQTADEVAAAMDWLLSSEAARLTGQVLAVAGATWADELRMGIAAWLGYGMARLDGKVAATSGKSTITGWPGVVQPVSQHLPG
jgi:hypothetical protein